MKKAFFIIALAVSAVAFAATETVEIEDGGTWPAVSGRVAAIRVLSTAASGAFTLKGIESWNVSSNVSETVVDSVPMWRRVITNGTETVTNVYPGQVVYTPPPPWKLSEEGWITNTVTTTRVSRRKTGGVLAWTNSLAAATCSGGSWTNAPAGLWLADGERVTFSFSTAGAAGRALIIIER